MLEEYVVELMYAALHARTAAPKPEGITWDQLYRVVVRHSIQSLVFPALSKEMLADMPTQLAERWKHDSELALYRQVCFDIEREAIVSDFRKAGLSWLPLKGILVATYYPQPGMRSMGDQDIVFGFVQPSEDGGWEYCGGSGGDRADCLDKADAVLTGIMRRHGFAEETSRGREHSFMKGNLCFEMHRSMVSATEMSVGQANGQELEYYDNPWALAHPVGEVPGEFRFSPSEEYIFHVSHMFKHYRGYGFGLRFLADEYVYCMRFPKAVRSTHVEDVLGRLGLAEFERSVRELSLSLFAGGSEWSGLIGERGRVLLGEIVSGGVYGSLEHRVAMRMSERGRDENVFRYWMRRLFPPKEWMEAYYPAWSRNGFTRFLAIFYRLFRGLSGHPERLKREIRLTLHRRGH